MMTAKSRPKVSPKAVQAWPKVEELKEQSSYLRYPLIDELITEATNINEGAAQLMKFHGSYQQDDREKRTFGEGKFYQFMMRTRTPSGIVPSRLYLVMDDLADQYGNGTLRLTTRQAFQLHGVLKQDLKTVFSTVIKNMGSTLAACGDVNRNITAPPVPYKTKPEYLHAVEWANHVKDLLAPQGGGYYDVWLDGEKFMTQEVEAPFVKEVREDNSRGINGDDVEPIYGDVYLPRKFKIGVTVPGDNHIDLFTNDLGLITITNAAGELMGFNITAGGGMGNSHRNDETHPRLADILGFVPKERALHAVKAIVCVQRDYGRRDDRKMSRMKYTVERLGLENFIAKVEEYQGFQFEAPAPMAKWEFKNYLGWGEQGDGKLFVGVHVVNGRVRGALKKAVATVVGRYELEVRLTANQDLILCDVDPSWKADIQATLDAAGVADPDSLSPIVLNSIACPALPLCGLAITEAERGLPDVNARLDALLTRMGMKDEGIVIRMTGCPNGCARPYMAELGFVGDGPNTYEIWLGGCPDLTRLAEPYQQKVKLRDFETFFEPLFAFFKSRRKESESFGDFCSRIGFVALREYQKAYVSPPSYSSQPRLAVDSSTFDALKAIAEKEGLTISEAAAKVVTSYSS